MRTKALYLFLVSGLLLSGCSVWQSAVKSTFPYTTTITIPRSSADNVVLSASGTAQSFDQNFNKNGTNADKVKEVKIVSAKIESDDPSDFNLGNLSMIKVYLAKSDGSEELLVASRTDITALVGNSLVLDIDNTKILDEQVNEPNVSIRVEYQLRDHIYVNAHLKVVLGLRASP
ncbi:MAG TPA: hypothetical protein VFE53_01985 [Mucilaginibacter sp.]|jgi:hypothetical protein|nr:hypothetical protein [Mucilaginibacter sp.]